jgi:hypothetical protein
MLMHDEAKSIKAFISREKAVRSSGALPIIPLEMRNLHSGSVCSSLSCLIFFALLVYSSN